MRIWMWPKSSELNFYNNLLTDSLSEAGMQVMDLQHGRLTLQVRQVKPGDIVHIHWMHHAYQHRHPLLFIVKSLVFILTLFYLKLRSVRLVWTLHNLYPHNAKFHRMERFMRIQICRFCSRLIVASEAIKRKVVTEFGVSEKKLYVVKHGHYLGVYESQGVDFRQRYRMREHAQVYLFLGAVKAYKGVDHLIEAFNAIKTRQTYLVIAGQADRETAAYLEQVRDRENIVLDLRFIPNAEVADLIGAADVMVMPYKEITTSGSAILGLSFKKLIVMPDNDFMDEYFKENMVVRYDKADPQGLQTALREALHTVKADKSVLYDEVLKELEWSVIAQRIKNVYQGWG